jgi:hypothetical protein
VWEAANRDDPFSVTSQHDPYFANSDFHKPKHLYSADAITEIQRALHVLDRFGRAQRLGREVRTALRVRMMALVDRLEIEQAKQRIVEGNFAAARYHLGAARHRPLKVRAAQIGLTVAPRLLRAAYLMLRPAPWLGVQTQPSNLTDL